MAADAPALIQLRELLAEKFPQAMAPRTERQEEAIASGLPALDAALGGGFSKRTLTEITGGPGNVSLVIHHFLQHAADQGMPVALVDSVFGFDPATVGANVRPHLLWVACENCVQAMKAADMLLRDGNLRVVILDLLLVPAQQLRRISLGHWHRLQRLVEESGATALVLASAPLVAGRRIRISLEGRWGLEALRQSRDALEVRFVVQGKGLSEPIRRIA